MDHLEMGLRGRAARAYFDTVCLRVDPPLFATRRWYRCPPGALPFPGEHSFPAAVWHQEVDWVSGDSVGPTTNGIDQSDRGIAPLGVCGCTTPTPLSWFLDGVPEGITGPSPNGPCPVVGEAFRVVLCIGASFTVSALRLEDLSDVLVLSVSDGQLLGWNAAQGKWVNVNPPTGGVSSFNTRTGAVALTSGDVISALGYTPGTGTVTTLSIVPANGISGTVANPTTTPAVTLVLGAITPSSVSAHGSATGLRDEFFGSGAGSGATTGNDDTFVGHNAGMTCTTMAGNTCVGSGADLSTNSIQNAVAVGFNARALGTNATILGALAQAGTSGVALGEAANAGSGSAVAIGQSATASAGSGVGIGSTANVSGAGAVGVGAFATISTGFGVAVGYNNSLSIGSEQIALGHGLTVTHANCCLIGTGATSGQAGELRWTNSATGATRIGVTALSSTTADRKQFALDGSWISNTDATRTARLQISAFDAGGQREGLRIDTDGLQALLSFYGVTAVARQLLATGAGHTVDDVIAALQVLGLLRQS